MGTLVWVVVGIVVFSALLYFAATALFGPGEPIARAGEGIPAPLPQGRDLDGDDIDAVELPVAVRGYRMKDVDELLQRVAAQLRSQQSVVGDQTPEPTAPNVGPTQAAEDQTLPPEAESAESAFPSRPADEAPVEPTGQRVVGND